MLFKKKLYKYVCKSSKVLFAAKIHIIQMTEKTNWHYCVKSYCAGNRKYCRWIHNNLRQKMCHRASYVQSTKYSLASVLAAPISHWVKPPTLGLCAFSWRIYLVQHGPKWCKSLLWFLIQTTAKSAKWTPRGFRLCCLQGYYHHQVQWNSVGSFDLVESWVTLP